MRRIRIRTCTITVAMTVILGILLGAKPVFAQQDAKGRKKPDNTAAKKQQAEKLFEALKESWEIETDLAKARSNLARKEAVLEKALDNASAAEKAAKKSADDKKLAQKAADAASTAGRARVARDAAQETLNEKNAAIGGALDKAATLEAELLGGLKIISSKDWNYEKARHLLFRAGFGGSPQEVERLVDMGLHKAVEYLVEIHQQPSANLEIDIRPRGRGLSYERYFSTEARRELQRRQRRNFRNQVSNLRQWWLQRMVESPRPLEEKLTLFWHDHFAVNYRDFNDPYLIYTQNQLFRRYADQFSALLHGIVQDPAMIRYLDNHTNRKGNGNENLGRELQELFSLGEENSANHKKNGYTEEDVREASRALTGYTYDQTTGQFRFLGSRFDETQKTVLGRKGNWSGDEVVDIILQRPATAQYVSKKLFEFFVHRDPKPETVETLAHVLRSNNYNLRPMLENLFLSEEFYSDQARGSHIKSPVELLVGTIKMLGIRDVEYGRIDSACQTTGHALFEPPNVAGWDEGQAWITSKQLLDRYNFVADLIDQRNVDVVGALVGGREFESADEVVDHLVQRCLVTDVSNDKRQAMIDFLGDLPPSTKWDQERDQINAKLRALVVMLLGTPEFQVS